MVSFIFVRPENNPKIGDCSGKNEKNNIDSLSFFNGTLKTLEQAWLRPTYDGYMYFQDVAGTIINKYLATGNDINIVIDQLTLEFEKSFNVNK